MKKMNKTRRPGRPKTQCIDAITNDLNEIEQNTA